MSLSLILDPAEYQTSIKFKKFCHQVGTTLHILEEKNQWANQAELYFGIFKKSLRKDIQSTNFPMRLWDYCVESREKIHNVTPHNMFQLNGNTPTVATHGAQRDISNICQSVWYDWCYFLE